MDMDYIETVDFEYESVKVNEKIRQGWRLLAITQVGNQDGMDTQYILGMRRMWKCGCGKPMTTYIPETNHWRCDDPTHDGNPA